MTEISSDTLLEHLEAEELAAIAWDDRLLGLWSSVKRTSEIADAKKLKFPLPDRFTIKRKRKLVVAISIVMAGLFTLLFGHILLTKYSPAGLMVSILLLSVLYLVLYKNLTSPEINFAIELSKEGIAISDKIYQWVEIQETFFVTRPKGRSREQYFVLGLKNGFLDRYHMNNLLEFNMNEGTFSAVVEAYRKSSTIK